MVIADTSTWINHLRGKKDEKTEAFKHLLNNSDIVLIPVIIQEVLQGFRYIEQAKEMEKEMLKMLILQLEQILTAIGCAKLYMSLRNKGITIRKSQDVIIGYYAIHFNIPLLHSDKDFGFMAQETDLKIYTV